MYQFIEFREWLSKSRIKIPLYQVEFNTIKANNKYYVRTRSDAIKVSNLDENSTQWKISQICSNFDIFLDKISFENELNF